MKVICTLIFSCSILSSGFLLAQQQQTQGCSCRDCKCTVQSHCGCLSNKGCTCGEKGSCGSNCGCGCGNLLSFNDRNYHHFNPAEHEVEHDIVEGEENDVQADG